MNRANARELREETIPVLLAHVSEQELQRILPVRLEPLDPLSAAEPSVGALVKLACGELFVAVYGQETGTLRLQVPSSRPLAINSLLREIPIRLKDITWRADGADEMNRFEGAI